MRVEGVALEDHRDVAILRRLVVHHHVADLQRAASDVFKSSDHAQRGGLPAARRSNEDHELAVHNIEREVVDGEHLAVLLRHAFKGHR